MADSTAGYGFFADKSDNHEETGKKTEAIHNSGNGDKSPSGSGSSSSSKKSVESTENQGDNRYLVFKLGQNQFATPLLKTREVIEPVETSGVPNTRTYFTGVANIRGEVVGIIELNEKFGINKDDDAINKHPAIILFECETGTLGVHIDAVIGVESIAASEIETSPHIKSMIPQKYLIGIAKTNMGLISVIDLKKILDEDDLVMIKRHASA